MEENKLLKALTDISLGYTQGDVSIDILRKACETYKTKVKFNEDFDYELIVTKSCFDYINNTSRDLELEKAIVPGQTKVIDGVMYVYSATKQGSQTQYAWHVVKKSTRGVDVGKGSKMSQKDIDANEKYVNELFPQDLSTLKFIKQLNGSTRPELVEDVNGNRFVKKQSGNTNAGHVKNEYMANQLYDLLGFNVPDFELYDDNGKQITLSKFIPMTRNWSASDFKEMSKGFVADCLLANWDVFKNDNILIGAGGKILRMDNGGSLFYRAQGDLKNPPFGGDVLQTFKSMNQYNPQIYAELTNNDILQQINDIRAHKNDIIAFLNDSGEPALAKIMNERINNLDKVEKWLNNNVSIQSVKPQPRKLKSEKEMYRTLTDKELEDAWKNVVGNYSAHENKIYYQSKEHGWDLLNTICELRGFNARPKIVDDDEYWKIIGKDSSTQLFRGVKNGDGITAEDAVRNTFFEDSCFYGTMGAYGEGIYAHRNDKSNGKNKPTTQPYTKKDNYTEGGAYKQTVEYAGYGSGVGIVMKGCLDPKSNIVGFEELQKEINDWHYAKNIDKKQLTKLTKEKKRVNEDLLETQDEIDNFKHNLEQGVYKQMGFDRNAYDEMINTFDTTDWDKKDAFGNRDIPTFHDLVETKMTDWVEKQGGEVTKAKGRVTFKFPEARDEFFISVLQYDSPFAVKKKNTFTSGYHNSIERFRNWVNSTRVKAIHDELDKETQNSGKKMNDLYVKRSDLAKDLERKTKEIDSLTQTNPDNGVLDAINHYKNHTTVLGLYAAVKGYDAIEVPDGNGRGNSYYVVLNRSKMIFSNKVDNV